MTKMKTTMLLSTLVFAAVAASGQSVSTRNQRATGNPGTQPAPTPAPGAGSSSGAQYVQVSVAPSAGVASTAGNSRRALRQSRNGRGAEYVGVSVAPRR